MRAIDLAAVLLVASGEALACGYCLEDQIATTYDHAVVTHALARKHAVVFMHVDGAVPSRRALERAVYSVPAVDRGTARVSPDLATVSFAFDPARAGLGALHAGLEKRLGVALMPLQVMQQ